MLHGGVASGLHDIGCRTAEWTHGTPKYGGPTSLPHSLEHLLLVNPSDHSHFLCDHVYIHASAINK